MNIIHYLFDWTKKSFNSQGNKRASKKILNGSKIKFVVGVA